jgi:hypothetical protein
MRSTGKFGSSKSGHKLKKPVVGLFKDAKRKSSKLLKSSQSQFSMSSGLSKFEKSMNLDHLASVSSNWLNSSAMQSQDMSSKLRTFKKGNHNYSSTHTP